jgi:hypothetical protein
VRAIPGDEELGTHGLHGGGGPIGRTLEQHWALRFDPPPDGATGLELLVDGLFVFRTGASDIVAVPAPQRDEAVDLLGYSLVCGSERVELLRWEPRREGVPSLVIAPVPSDCRPDVRVVSGASSASLWLERTPDGRYVGGLPSTYDALFDGDEVCLALRSVGRRVDISPITLALSSALRPD